jgi:hypothetical protein
MNFFVCIRRKQLLSWLANRNDIGPIVLILTHAQCKLAVYIMYMYLSLLMAWCSEIIFLLTHNNLSFVILPLEQQNLNTPI